MASSALALSHDGDATDTKIQASYRKQVLPRILDQIVSRKGIQAASKPENIASCFQSFLQSRSNALLVEQNQRDSDSYELIKEVLKEFCHIEASTEKRAGRLALEEAARQLLAASTCQTSSLLATLLVTITLALDCESDSSTDKSSPNRAIASSIVGVLMKLGRERGGFDSSDQEVARGMFKVLFHEATQNNDNSPFTRAIDIDWHIIAGLARAVEISCSNNDETMANDVAKVLTRTLDLDAFQADDSSIDPSDQTPKNEASASLALAAQFQPWQAVQPEVLVNLAISYDLWHAAERICLSTTFSQRGAPPTSSSNAAVDALLEGAFQAKQFRQADTFATAFFEDGGKSRYLEARYLHACTTIAKVIRKGAIPVVDKQVERVEKAAKKMRSEDVETSFFVTPSNAVDEIRSFTIQQMEETGNFDAAHRVAKMWGMDYVFDEETILAAEKARRAKYLQWEDVLPGSPPDLISTPDGLLTAMQALLDTSKGCNLIGFDAEWSEDDKGADLLQIASLTKVVLIDILALSKTPEGVDALARTVGHLFASDAYTKVGFACRQDLTKLRGSPTCQAKNRSKKHWFGESDEVVDLKTLIQTLDRTLSRFGLSRTCERYLGKPLDKSEQCSLWNARPLTPQQRTYAALDAWSVVAVYDKVWHKRGSLLARRHNG